jgi:hypothetical protein
MLVAELDACGSETLIGPDELPAVRAWGALLNESDGAGVPH